MPKVGIYCRLSVEDKDKLKCDNSQSIQNQKAMLREYCKERNWEIYDIYCDDGYSGIDRSRPEFNRLLHDCEIGKIDIVLCKDQSRFSRDIVVIEQIINDKFLEWGIRFIGVADNADTDSESYSTMRLFTSAYNEMYVKDISAKIRRTLAYKREQGQFIGSFAPYGYAIDPKDKHHLVIDPETAPVVKQIFSMYIEGNGYRKIVQTLNQQGIVSPTEYKRQKGSNYVNSNADASNAKGLWTQSTIAKILTNEMYTGTLVQGKSHHISYKNKKRKKVSRDDWIRIPDAHEAIIDLETWTRTQERLHSNTRVGKRSQELSPLSGKVKCAVCGRPMKRNVYYNKSKTIKYYGLQCATYKTGAMNCPNQKSISGLMLEKKILDELNLIVESYCQSDEIRLTDIHQEQINNLNKQLSALEERHKSAKNRLVSMYKDKLDGILSDEDYALFRENLTAEEQAVSRQIDDITQQIQDSHKCLENAESQKTLIQKYTHFDHLDRSIADEFIDTIEIGMVSETGEREVHIYWKL
ncbi:MAG: recombinase family protein [Oscillospiraceae bacterium]|nr:recombinase family protein [Oscillospiraceae bacterium]